MRTDLPRLMLAAPASGSGKTTLTIALMAALQKRGLTPASFKCGPDYIDPMFHREVLGIPGYNLDLFFTPARIVRGLLVQGSSAADIAVLEGVMGYYDGAGMTDEASSWHLAHATGTPTVLVVRPRGAALSTAALVHGFMRFREPSQIQGVLLNEATPAMSERLAALIERECGLHVYGALPTLPDVVLKSRHLGLVTPHDVENVREKTAELADQLAANADIDGLLALAQTAPPLDANLPDIAAVANEVRIAVARDEAFCFYYRENLELLERLGATLVPFSPLRDGHLPATCGGLYIGGGYPELHAKTLAGNEAMRAAIKAAIDDGLPTLAESGGFLYLGQHLEDTDGISHPMVGALTGDGFATGRLGRFGYVSLTAEYDNLLCQTGDVIKAHEFHYWDSTHAGAAFVAQKPHSDQRWSCVQATKSLYAGFPHLYFWSNPTCAVQFVQAAFRFLKEKNK